MCSAYADNALFDQNGSDRIVLVGFKDHSIDRVIQTVSTTDSYRKRGDYRSSAWSQRIADDIADQYKLDQLSDWPITELGIHCVIYQVPLIYSVDTIISRLKSDHRFELVQKMHTYKTRGHSYSDPYFNLQNGIKAMNIEKIHAITTGKNIKVGIIDTGIDIDHPDLEGQIIQNDNFVKSLSAEFSADRHGTAVAGVIAARMNNGAGIVGIAPDADLIALKACWPTSEDQMEATCNTFSLALAINAAIKMRVDVLNMSLSGPEDPLLKVLLKKAFEKNIILVAADPGDSYGESNRFPALMDEVLGVQSQREKLMELPFDLNGTMVAPGNTILTTVPDASYDFVSGSSIAAAHVSGVVALLLQLKPNLTIEQIRAFLSHADLPNQVSQHSGLGINPYTAVSELCQAVQCSDTIND